MIKVFLLNSKKSLMFFLSTLIFLLIYAACSNEVDSDFDEYTIINKYQEGEENLSDNLSIAIANNNAFGQQIPGLDSDRTNVMRFASGNSLFNQSWTPSPSTTKGLDGLGPTFNSRACASCHFKDGRGKPFEFSNIGSKGFLLRLSNPGQNIHGGPQPIPNYGTQLQNHSNLNIPREGNISVNFTLIEGTYDDGTKYELRKPNYGIINENFGSLSNALISPRIGQQTIGLGLIDALSEDEILKNDDEFDINNDGISGKANYVWDAINNKKSIGKFGWKSNQPSLKQQIADAFFGDIGLTTNIFNENPCPEIQKDCYERPNGGDPEVTDKQIDRILFYQSSLAVPKRRNFKEQNVLNGKVLFTKLQCISCHSTNLKTSSYPFNTLLENKIISPYSDFLLHDMGSELADDRPDFLANGNEWRTQPLWGIGLINTVNKHTFLLHDGRARNIEEAVLWHGGEAENSKKDFKKLSKLEREELLSFIESL